MPKVHGEGGIPEYYKPAQEPSKKTPLAKDKKTPESPKEAIKQLKSSSEELKHIDKKVKTDAPVAQKDAQKIGEIKNRALPKPPKKSEEDAFFTPKTPSKTTPYEQPLGARPRHPVEDKELEKFGKPFQREVHHLDEVFNKQISKELDEYFETHPGGEDFPPDEEEEVK